MTTSEVPPEPVTPEPETTAFHTVTVHKSRHDATECWWFQPYCTCGWQGFLQKQLGTPGTVEYISSYDNAWLLAGLQGKDHVEKETAE